MANNELFNRNVKLKLLLEEAALNGTRRAERYPESRFFGYFCSYWPEELVLASGLEPLRILPLSAQGTPAELPAYCCSLARASLASAETIKDLAGVGFAHTCDTMQCLGGVWDKTYPYGNTLTIVPPVILNTPSSAQYFQAELENLLIQLGKITSREPGLKELNSALELYDHIHKLTAELDNLRPLLPSPIVSALLRAGQVMPRVEYATALEAALPTLKEKTTEPHDRHRILISTAVLENDSVFQMIEELGGRVVADDTCTGFRHFNVPQSPKTTSNPIETIAYRYIEMPPCPCRSHGLAERRNYLVRLARNRLATGAILIIRKYCEPHAWDAASLSEHLRANGIQTLVLELDGADVGGQERTRIQAFLESL